jgi:DNA-directed RNA polymerase subunit L
VYDLVFYDENDTLGNILSEYLAQESDVKYVGYRLSHPQKYEMLMKITLSENNNKEGIVKKYIEVINKILKILDELL